jgi:hypothetical protein
MMESDAPQPPVRHPEPVEADVIVRVDLGSAGAPALVTPLGDQPPSSQEIPARISERMDGRCGYFRARWGDGRWQIGEPLPRPEWPVSR